MENQVIAVVPSKERHVFVSSQKGDRLFKKPAEAASWFHQNGNSGITVLSVMGGPGQEFFIRLQDLGISVQRLPMYRLQEMAGVEPKASASDRAAGLQLAWESKPETFYELGELDPNIVLICELTRQRLNVQEFRKMATLQLHSALRSLEFVLPAEAATVVELLRKGLKDLFRKPEIREQIEEEFRRLETQVRLSDFQQSRLFAIRRFFSNPRFVLGAKEDERELEKQTLRLLSGVPIWQALNGEDSVLPSIKGLGPAIGGSIISEIGDIRRFPSPENLRAYARFHVGPEGNFPHRKKGEISAFNRYLARAVWLWSSDQMPRYDHPWKSLYLWKKARELQTHPEPVVRQVADRQGRPRTVHDFTLKHLDSRAKRWTGSQLLNYLWAFWQEVAAGRNPEEWYPRSSWPAYFKQAEQALDSGLLVYLENEIPKRRRQEPVVEEEEGKE